jgi:hypothetical protein
MSWGGYLRAAMKALLFGECMIKLPVAYKLV